MKKFTFLLIWFLLATTCSIGQEKPTVSSSWIPLEMKNQLIHVEKYSEISTDESVDIANSKSAKSGRDNFLENIYFYNLVFRRKINNEIQTVFEKSELDNIKTASSRDIEENLDNNIRFILKADFSSKDLVTGEIFDPSYYIYDQERNIRYHSFASLELMLKSLKSFNWYAENRITAETKQATIDDYIERSLPNERKRIMTKSTRNIILGTLAVVGINILAYIVSN